MTDGTALSPAPVPPREPVAAQARAELRHLLSLGGAGVMLARIEAIGRDPIAASCRSVARLAEAGTGAIVETILDRLKYVVERVHDPASGRRRLFLAHRIAPIEERLRTAEPVLSALLADLARERDRLAQAVLAREQMQIRAAEAEESLAAAAALLERLAALVESAVRELGQDAPQQAALLAGEVTARLIERRHDVLMQLAVQQQAMQASAMLIAAQGTSLRSADRTRTLLVSALRSAVLASTAVAETGRRQQVTAAVAEMRNAVFGPDKTGAGE